MTTPFLIPKAKKPVKDDSCLLGSNPRRNEDDDQCSLEANSNLDWRTGKRGKKRQKIDEKSEYTIIPSQKQQITIEGKEGKNSIPAQEFYTSSHYFIDQLKDEYFVCKEGESWYTSKEEIDLDTLILPVKRQALNKNDQYLTGKWTIEEHQTFLDSLRKYGKDWPKIQEAIGTRDIKSVVSHGQKFLNRLIRLLNNEETIEHLSLEDAQTFYGILKVKNNRSTIQRQQREARETELKGKGFLFLVERTPWKKGPSMNPLDTLKNANKNLEVNLPLTKEPTVGSSEKDSAPEETRAEAEPEINPPKEEPKANEAEKEQEESKPEEEQTHYQKWKQEIIGESADSNSFHHSLGHSIKMRISNHGSSIRQKIEFKSSFRYGTEDDDSAASQSRKHQKKFNVTRSFDSKIPESKMRELVKKMHVAFKAFKESGQDLESATLYLCTADKKELDVYECLGPDSLLSSLAYRPVSKEANSQASEAQEYFHLQMKERMDNGWLSDDRTASILEFERILESSPEEQAQISFFFKPKKLEKDMDLCTDFEHETLAATDVS